MSPVCACTAPVARVPEGLRPSGAKRAAAHAGPTHFPEWSPLGREVGGEHALRSFLLCQQKTVERGKGKLRFAWVSSEPGAEINARRGARRKGALRRRRGGRGGARCEGHRMGGSLPSVSLPPDPSKFALLQACILHTPPSHPQPQLPTPFLAAQHRPFHLGSLSLPSIPLDDSPWSELTGDSTGDPPAV